MPKPMHKLLVFLLLSIFPPAWAQQFATPHLAHWTASDCPHARARGADAGRASVTLTSVPPQGSVLSLGRPSELFAP
jgi:hypothetical protein